MTTLYIDADACPVKAEAERVATRLQVPVKMVCNGGLRPSRDPMVENVIVGAGFDAADDWIAERARPGDIVVTADVPDHAVVAGNPGSHRGWICPCGERLKPDVANCGCGRPYAWSEGVPSLVV